MKSKVGILTALHSPIAYAVADKLSQDVDVTMICEGHAPDEEIMAILRRRTAGQVGFHTPTGYEALGVPFYFVSDINNQHARALFVKFDVLVNCGISRKISKEVLFNTGYGVLNSHPGKLPEYRGRNPVEWALWNKAPKLWVTSHFMAEELDAGNIVSEVSFSPAGMTYEVIRAQMLRYQANCLVHAARCVLEERRQPSECRPQQGATKVWPKMPEEQIQELARRLREDRL